MSVNGSGEMYCFTDFFLTFGRLSASRYDLCCLFSEALWAVSVSAKLPYSYFKIKDEKSLKNIFSVLFTSRFF